MESIQNQNLEIEYIRNIQIILVDDGSKLSITEILKKYKFDLNITTITFGKNQGVSAARNAGLGITKNEITLFMDSDIILANNFLKEMLVRISILPNGIFMSMRHKIHKNDLIVSEFNKVIHNPINPNDSRFSNKPREDQDGWTEKEITEKRTFEILEDSNYFKELGFGNKIGIYSLPTIVSGHNIILTTNNAKKVHGFSLKFERWGMEDTFFGASLAILGNYFIPVLSTGVYHIGTEPRENNLEKKKFELNNNINIYNKLLEEDI